MNNREFEQFRYRKVNVRSPIGGAFFFVLGLIGVAFILGRVLAGNPLGEQYNSTGVLLFLTYSIGFVLLGAYILFYKRELLIDRASQELLTITSLPFFEFISKRVPISEIIGVDLNRKFSGNQIGVGLQFTVSLMLSENRSMYLESFIDYENARRLSELLAKSLNRPCHDISSGRMVIRETGKMTPSLLKRIKENTVKDDEPLRPNILNLQYQKTGDISRFIILPFHFITSLTTIFLPATILLLIFSWISSHYLDALPPEIIIYALLIPLVFILTACSFLFQRESVTISPKGFFVKSDLLFFTVKKKFIPLNELQALYLIGKEKDEEKRELLGDLLRGTSYEKATDFLLPYRCLSSTLIASSEKTVIHIGRALDYDELCFLHYLIRKTLRAI